MSDLLPFLLLDVVAVAFAAGSNGVFNLAGGRAGRTRRGSGRMSRATDRSRMSRESTSASNSTWWLCWPRASTWRQSLSTSVIVLRETG